MSGYVDGRLVSASWTNNFLIVDPALRERADVLVAMGQTFSADGVSLVVNAGLTSLVAAALTLLQCFDEIADVEMLLECEGVEGDDQPEVMFSDFAAALTSGSTFN
jgi:hypothetical protein